MQELKTYLKGKVKQDFAKRVGIVPAYLSQILSEKKRPGYDLMCRIADETNGAVPVSAWRQSVDEAAQ